jgi:hypothetical protein
VLSSTSATAGSHGAIKLKLSCPTGEGACSGTVTLTLAVAAPSVALAARVHRPSIPVTLTAGSASFNCEPGTSQTVTLALSPTVLKLLAQHRTLRLAAKLLTSGGTGPLVVRTGAITVKAASKKSKKPKAKKQTKR